MTTPRVISISVFEADEYDDNWPPKQLNQFASWLNAVIDKIPEEHRPTAIIDIDSRNEWRVGIEIKYERPETDEDIAERAREARGRRAAEEARERAQYEKLKAKFDPR